MRNKSIHIVALDVPYPADYGGAIDMYYRIKALYELGFDIDLHCFEYGRGRPDHLQGITSSIHYYRRDKNLTDWFSPFPFIVKTRRSSKLFNRLLEDDNPILFEGIHSTFYLGDERLKDRLKIVRTHNIEHEYYSELAKLSRGAKKRFYLSEARKLKKYEPVLSQADHILAIQRNDVIHFKQYTTSHLLPASTPEIMAREQRATDPYCLFHGNLSVPENENAAIWIMQALDSVDCELIIAGKNPTDKLADLCKAHSVELVANPNADEMETLIQEARVHALFTDQATGLKLKLLNALNSSGHVVVNNKMLAGTQLQNYCIEANKENQYASAVQNALSFELPNIDFSKRQAYLQSTFNTRLNCELIAKLINA